MPSNAVLEEGTDQQQPQNEDIQFADHEFDNVDYDGDKYIEMYSPKGEARQSLTEGGTDGIFDVSREASVDQVHNSNQLAQASVHSSRSTKSASYIPMRHLVKKSSKDNMMEKKTSFGSLTMSEKKHTAQSLGIKTGSSFLLNRTPVVKDSLKPATPSQQSDKTKPSGFALLKVGAAVLRRQIDETGSTWLEYQAADNGPIFYAEEGGTSAGQWNRPTVFDLEDFSSASVISVEPVDFGALDDALISRPSSRKDLNSSSNNSMRSTAAEAANVETKPAAAAAATTKPKVKVRVLLLITNRRYLLFALIYWLHIQITHYKPPEEPKNEERKSLFGSFINSVFVETVAKEDQVFSIDANMTLDALFGVDDEEVTEGTSSKPGSQKEQLLSPLTGGAAEGLFTPPNPNNSFGDNGLSGGADAGLESPAERIALTPVRKLPPGSGMRKVRHSHFLGILYTKPC